MASIKYDVSDVEAGGGGVQPQPALYKGKIVDMTHRSKKADGSVVSDLEVVVDVGQEYARLWTYVKLPDDPNYSQSAHGWKLRELTDALDLPPKGSIDPKKITSQKPSVLVKVKSDTDEDGDYRGKIKNLFKPGSVEDGDVIEATSGGGAAADDFTAWDDDDLKAELAEKEITVSGRWSREKAIAALEEAAGDGDAEPEAEPDAEPTTEDDDFDITNVDGLEDFENWTNEDLKEELENIQVKLSGRFSETKAREAIIEHHREAAGGGDGAVEDEYDEWTDEDLDDEIKSRNEQGADIKISGRKNRQKMIDALREDNKNAEPF